MLSDIERQPPSPDGFWKGLKLTTALLAASALPSLTGCSSREEERSEPPQPAARATLDPAPQRVPALEDAALPYVDRDYHTAAELRSEAEKLVLEHPNLAAIKELGTSAEGRPLWCLVISDNAAKEEHEPKTAYIAGIHGDERAQPEMLLGLSKYLLSNYPTDERVRKIVDNSWIAMVVCANPDGWELGTRRNANDVDLNRDFPSIHAGNRVTTKGRQPETLAIMRLMEEQPFGLVIDFHATGSSGGVIFVNTPYDDHPARNSADRFPDYQTAVTIAHAYADAHPVMRNINNEYLCNGVTAGGGAAWFEAPTGPDCHCVHYDTTALTVELSNPKATPAEQLPRYFADNLESFLVCLELGQTGFHLEVVDEEGKAINGAIVAISSSQRNQSFDEHRLHRLAAPGKHEVIVSHWGYKPTAIWAEARRFDGEYTKVVLKKDD